MVYRHCAHHRCSNIQSVKDIVTALNQVLGQQCAYESEDEVKKYIFIALLIRNAVFGI